MKAIYGFDVKDMPVAVAVDSSGTSVHDTRPEEWEAKLDRLDPLALSILANPRIDLEGALPWQQN